MKSIVKRKVSPTLVLVFHRYFKFILLPIEVILGMPWLYIKRVDPMSSSTMYMSLMAVDWRLEQLEQCKWYLDCPKIKTPPLILLFKINCWTSNKEETSSYEERWFRPSSNLQGQMQSQTLGGWGYDHLVGNNASNPKVVNIVNSSSNVLLHAIFFVLLGTPSRMDVGGFDKKANSIFKPTFLPHPRIGRIMHELVLDASFIGMLATQRHTSA